ncbi:arylsulfatase [Psychroserpens jangbogonensis]|uniref:arylsulfatase n=1 Tax=Psychroserpens jangbogonensis TaxID=1484460 RepID=UPI00053E2420|nr:arylsulfatase [Psychroserpens jangbogonensis]
MKKYLFTVILLTLPFIMVSQSEKPNILVIWGDDIGWSNASIYNRGMMGYKTPNIDKIGKDGIMFTDYYSQQSCTAGRAAFITGQSPYRTGLTKVGLPGAKEGLSGLDPTIAELLKNHGYATGQFGKNHLGDRDEHLPTNHGFDEFLGNLYHLNAEEEPEHPDYPKGAEFKKKFGPRGVMHSYSDGKIEDTGPLTKKRMETVDYETRDAAIAFMKKSVADDKPFFTWYNSTLMHVWTHLEDKDKGTTGLGVYADGMVKLDKIVGELTKTLEDLGIEENTIVIFGTDNGAEIIFWPDGGMTPFRGEKATTWEGGFRAPCLIKWPAKIKPGQVSNAIISGEDWLPTFLAAAGEADVKEKLLKGHSANGKNFNVHLDGYNMLPLLTGEVEESPRKEIYYFDDDGSLNAFRYGRWKMHFKIQENHGFDVWQKKYTELRFPMLMDLYGDPYERAQHDSEDFYHWIAEHAFILVPAQAKIGEFLATFQKYPQRQEVGSFSLDKVLDQMQSAKRN